MTSAKSVLNIEASQIGYQDNSGARYWSVLKPGWTGQPWCATFQQWANKKAGAAWIPGDYYCPSIENEARRRGDWLDNSRVGSARPGDLILFHFGHPEAIHIERVERVLDNGYVQTIGGNTSNGNGGSQNNGRGVWRRIRHISQARGFVQQHLSQTAARSTHLAVDGVWGQATTRQLQRVLNTPVDGIISSQPDWNFPIYGLQVVRHPQGSQLIRKLQIHIGAGSDGLMGPGTVKHIQAHLGTTQDGKISKPSSRMVIAMQKRLNDGKF